MFHYPPSLSSMYMTEFSTKNEQMLFFRVEEILEFGRQNRGSAAP